MYGAHSHGLGGHPMVAAVRPVGIFWDIENCPVPKGKSASSVIHFIRNFFVVNRLNNREYEFFAACDVTRIRKDVADDINKAGGVTLAHVSGNSKNAADEKLRESMKRFVDTHAPSSPTLILISGDIDFVNDLRAYQTRLGCTIIVLHGPMCSQHFKTGWNEIYSFDTFLVMMDAQFGGGSVAGPAAVPNSCKASNGKADKPKQGCPSAGPKDPHGKPVKEMPPTQGGSGGPGKKGPGGPGAGATANGPKPNNVRHPGPGKKGPGSQLNDPGKVRAKGGNNPPQNKFQGADPTVNQVASSLNQLSVNPQAQQPKTEWILMVTGLPGKLDFRILKDHLQEYASTVKGRVKYVKNGQGFITFNKKQNADTAIQLFNGLEVYGKNLNVGFVKSIPFANPEDKKKAEQSGFVMVNPQQTASGGKVSANDASPKPSTWGKALGAFALGMQELADQNNSGKRKNNEPSCPIQ